MSKWAAIVYARTYEVDFRFIAVPEGFSSENKEWLWDHIRVTIRLAEKLRGNPRWSIFMNGRYCVVGVTCMASDLIGTTEDSRSEDITRDFQGRQLYLFAGYVAELDRGKGLPLIPQYSGNDIQLFKPLYSYISKQWLVKSFQPASKVAVQSEYHELAYSPIQNSPFDTDFFSLNIDDRVVTLWPNTEENRNHLWMAASRSMISQCNSVSLCLGLGSQIDVVDSLFLNATATDTMQKDTLSRVRLSPVNPTPVTSQTYSEPESSAVEERAYLRSQNPFPPQSESTQVNIWEPLGGLIGATIVARIAGLVVGSIIGGSLGWIIIGWLTNKGIGGALARQSRKLFSDLDAQKAETKQPPGFRNSHLRQKSGDQSELPGFKQKSQRGKSKRSENSEEGSSDWF